MGIFEDELRKAQQWRAQMDAQDMANQAQLDYENRLAAANQAASQAQNTAPGGLAGVLAGIGNSIKNVGDTLYNMGGTGIASLRDIVTGNAGTGKYQKEWKEYAKENIYKDKDLSDKDYYAKTGGKALDAAATVSDFIPGVGTGAKVALNVGQGVASGVAQNYIDNGADVSLEDNLKGALVGGASAGVGQAVGGKLAKGIGGNGAISKALNSNIGRGALTGAASGATGAGLSTALNGGGLGEVLGSAAQGAGGGALGGAAMAGVMGLASKGVNAVNDKLMGKTSTQAPSLDTTTPKAVDEVQPVKPVDETLAARDVTEAPKAKVQLDPVEEAKLDRKYTVAKQKQGQALMAQYGSIDAPTARSVGDAEGVLTRLYDDYGLETPADVAYAAKKLTGDEGIVTKMTRKLAASAGDIPANYDAPDLDRLIIESGLGLDSSKGKALKQQITSIIESTRMSSPTTANANDVLDMVKKLERKSADVAGKSGNNYHRATSEDLASASVINAVASDYKDRIWNGAKDISTVLTPDTIDQLKSVFPKNQKYQNGVDNIIAKATNGQELRHTMADLVNGSKISKNSKMISGTVGAQMVKAATSANPVVAVTQMAATKALGSDTANKMRASRYAKQAAKAQAQLTGETPVNLNTGKNAVKDAISKVGDKVGGAIDAVNTPLASGNWQSGDTFAQTMRNASLVTPSDAANLPALNRQSLSNALTGANSLINNQNVMTSNIARRAGLAQAGQVEAQRDMQNAQQEMQNAETDYNNAMTQAQQLYAQAQVPQISAGQQQLERIANAMAMALNAGDINAYSQLASLYNQAYKMYGAETEANNTANLNATQQGNLAKIQSASSAIDKLEQLYNQAGGGQGRLGGTLAEWGANLGMNGNVSSYNAMARGLINQIVAAVGKTDALNNEGEVQRALDLVPKITDTPQEAQIKLQSLREMLNANQQTYNNIYGVTQ